jgi:hypothetical protein
MHITVLLSSLSVAISLKVKHMKKFRNMINYVP